MPPRGKWTLLQKRDASQYSGSINVITAHHRDRKNNKKGNDGPIVVTGVYFLMASSESSSEMPERTQPQSTPARQTAKFALRLLI